MRRVCMAASFLCLIILIPAAEMTPTGAATPERRVQALRSDINRKIDNVVREAEQREQQIGRLIDALKGDLEKLVQNLKDVDDGRARLTGQRIDTLQTYVTEQIAAARALNEARAVGLSREIKSVRDDLPSLSPWVAVFVSIVSAIISAVVALSIASANRGHSDRQRKEEIGRSERERKEDIARIEKQMADDRDQARKQAKEATAYGFLDQWGLLHDDFGRARWYFEHPDQLTEDGYSLVAKVGNWYERLAQRYWEDTADRDILVNSDLVKEARIFLVEVLRTQTALANRAAVRSNFRDEVLRWPYLAKL